MIDTGADIVDIDHMVSDMGSRANELGKHQVFCGKSDPVTIIQNGTGHQIFRSVEKDHIDTGGRCFVSAGCEITPGTSVENMIHFMKSAKALS
jgi:uroporphyrinogen-III decarboxylase